MSPSAAKRLAKPREARVGTTVTAAGLDPDLGLDDLIVGRRAIHEKFRNQVVLAELERKMDGASTLTLTVRDPTRAFLQSEYARAGIRAEFDGIGFRLANVAKSGDEVTLTFEDEAVWKLRFKKGPMKATRGKVTRAQFALRLCREAGVVFVSPDVRKLQPVEKEEPSPDDEDKKPGFAPGASVRVKGRAATASQKRILSTVLAVGVKMDAPRNVLLAGIVAAVQESVVKNDVGKMVNGAMIDVGVFHQNSRYWPASRDVAKDAEAFFERALALYKANPTWAVGFLTDAVQKSYTYGTGAQGRDYQQHVSEAQATLRAYNGSDEVEDTSRAVETKKYEFTRGEPGGPKGENSWECITRLAREVNWRAYAHKGRVWFVSDATLMRARPIATVSEDLEWVINIDFDYELVPKSKRLKADLDRATITCMAARWAASPGMVVVLEKLGVADGRWLVDRVSRSLFSREATIELRIPEAAKPEPKAATEGMPNTGVNDPTGNAEYGNITTDGGAKGIVDQAFKVAKRAGGKGVYVVSAYRAGDTVGGGGSSDHAFNDTRRAARDIAVQGVNAITGPPHERLDRGMAALGRAFGRDYGSGRTATVDTFNWRGYRIQIIWRTPAYGGHMGHIHIGARKL